MALLAGQRSRPWTGHFSGTTHREAASIGPAWGMVGCDEWSHLYESPPTLELPTCPGPSTNDRHPGTAASRQRVTKIRACILATVAGRLGFALHRRRGV